MKRCDHCGGRLGLICQRYYARRFCTRACKGRYVERLRLGASASPSPWWQQYIAASAR